MSGGAIVGLLAVVGFGLIIAAAFFWLMPREENPGPLQTIWWGVRGTPEIEVARKLRRMQEAAEGETSEGLDASSDDEPWTARGEGGEKGASGRR
jgi:hypothetical protein